MHENLHVENSGLKQLENSTKEMKENILEEINRHFMDLRIGVNTNFKTLERIQEVNKTCSEMKDLFKARCTQSVTQSDNNTQSMIEKESGNSIEKSKNTNIQKVDLWVIGSSIVKDLDGSNDLEQKTPDDVLQEVELLVRELKSTLPESTVVIGELLPRYYLGDRNKADAYNEKIGLYNILLRDYCVDTGLHYVQFENMIHSDFYDGIHPNFKGVKLYVRCVKEILNPLLSVRYDKNYPRSFNNGYSVRSNYDQNRSGYNKRDTNGYQGYRQDKHNSYNRYTENTNNGYTDMEELLSITKRNSKRYNLNINGTKSQNRLWLKLEKEFFGFKEDLYLCALYIPPINSNYFENDYSFLENEISTFARQGKILLMGDMNARTGKCPDFITGDSCQINNFDAKNLIPNYYEVDTEISRNNQDNVTNVQGKSLLELCIASRLRILNGRFIGDSLGYYTYMSINGYSAVDYALISESLLSSVKYFKTDDFTYLSDHVQIQLTLNCNIKKNF
ncbi:unnamed protein product [Mytilus edulis]|uniref:Endonuclease/exonuclease/phosphatase domain-containing protein n=1 Tax=Mytilus edulis TaxID=6550 RepID=A0A8S3RUF7_MYTED|nr:unnamed protein product [Mytilus edulis]